MSKEKDSVKKERLSMFYKVAPVVGALVLAMLSAGFIVCRTLSNRSHHEKWKDYDECGI